MTAAPIHVLQLCHWRGEEDRHRIAAIVDQCQRFDADQAADVCASVLCVRPRQTNLHPLAQRAAEAHVRWQEVVRLGRADISLWWRLLRRIRRQRVDVVHTHDGQSHLMAMLLQPLLGFRLVATAADSLASDELDSTQIKQDGRLDHKLLPGFDRIIAANNQLAWQLCRLGCRPGQVDVIRTMVDTQRFCRQRVDQDLRAALRVGRHALLIGADARHATPGDIEILMQGMARAEKQLGPLWLSILCDTPASREGVARLAKRYGLTTRMRCWTPDERFPRWYSSLNVFVWLPSADAATASSHLEAFSMEVPVLCMHPAAESDPLIDDSTAIMVDRSAEAVADGIREVLANRSRARALAASGRLRICQRYGRGSSIRQLAGSYRRAIEAV